MATNTVIGVSLKFNADTSQAVQQMNQLKAQMDNIMSLSSVSTKRFALSSDIEKASLAAAQLKTSLNAAFNADTGKLDLTKFQNALKMSGTSLQQLKANMMAIGPEGQQAFRSLSMAIATSETPVIHLSSRLKTLLSGFASIARYQISTRMFTAIISGLKEAVNYSKELNESLNNIRIVTGKSVEEMDKFAERANKAAKALSTTTTAMTDAALIYFQQGLNMEEAQKRAEVTVKLANVTGQSVQDMSDRLTAVWNNFDNGSKSLEYYADVLTALGAATASSTTEITTGLEKFASIAETVGLSYEYAATALATVTATTRQSADTVGTAFKTLFARIQDLELGETLDDGVTLGKYSQALDAIGVSVLDSNGNMRQMNDILDDMGAKWNTLSQAQKTATAQTVAGVRQYTQLMALMENYDYFQENLQVAEGAEGTLQRQQDVYAESWEAASKRVKASLEEIYEKLFDDKGFIKLVNFGADFISVIDKIIDSMGGLKGVLLAVSTLLLNVYDRQISAAINRAQAGIVGTISRLRNGELDLTKTQAQLNTEDFKATSREQLMSTFGNDTIGSQQKSVTNELLNLQEKLYQNKKNLNEAEYQTLEAMIKQKEKAVEQYNVEQDKLKLALEYQKYSHVNSLVGAKGEVNGQKINLNTKEDAINFIKTGNQAYAAEGLSTKISEITGGMDKNNLQQVTALKQELIDLGASSTEVNDKFKQIFGDNTNIQQYVGSLEGLENKIKQVAQAEKERKEDPTNEEKIKNADILNGKYDNIINKLKQIGNLEINKGRSSKTDPEVARNYSKAKKSGQYDAFTKEQRKEIKELGALEAKKKSIGKLDEQQEKRLKDLSAKYNSLNAAQSQVTASAKNFEKATSGNIKTVGEQIDALGLSSEKAAALKASMEKAGHGMASGALSGEQLKKVLKENGIVIDELNAKPITFGQSITAAARTLSSVGMALSSLRGMWNTLNNEDATFFEKLISVMTTLGMVIPAVTTALNMQNVAKIFGITLTEIENKQIKLTAAGKIGEAIMRMLNKGAIDAENGSLIVQKALMWEVYLILAIIIAVIIAVAAAFKALANAIETDEEAMQRANETVNNLTTSLNDAKTAAESLKTAISDYTDALEELDKLDQSTKEYADQLELTNEKARALIETYKLYGKYTWENGQIKFNEGVLDQAQSQANKRIKTLQNMTNFAKINKNDMISNPSENDLKILWGYSSILDTRTTTMDEYNEETQEYEQKEFEEQYFRGIEDDEFNELIGAIEEVTEDGVRIDNVDDLKEKLLNNTSLSDTLKESLDYLIDDSYLDTINEYISSVKEATSANKEYARQILENIIREKYGEEISNLSGGDMELAESYVQAYTSANVQTTDKIQEKAKVNEENIAATITNNDSGNNIEGWAKNLLGGEEELKEVYGKIFNGQTYNGNINTTQMLKDVAEAKGYKDVTVVNKNGKLSYSYTDAEGNQITNKEISNKDVQKEWAQFISEYQVTTEMQNNGEISVNPTEIFEKAKSGANTSYGIDFNKVFVNAISNEGRVDLSGVIGSLNEEEYNQIKDMTEEELLALMGITKEDLTNIGLDADTFVQSFQSFFKNEWNVEAFKTTANAAGETKAAELGLDAEEFIKYRDELARVNEELAKNPELLNEVAVANMRAQRGFESASSGIEEWTEAINTASTDSVDYINAVSGIRDSIGDILNIDATKLSAEFLTATETTELLKQAAEGSTEALIQLRELAAKEIILNIDSEIDLPNEDEILTAVTNLQDEEITIGATLDDSQYAQELYNLLQESGAYAADIQEIFNSLGWTPEVKKQRIQVTASDVANGYVIDENGNKHEVSSGTKADSWIEVPMFAVGEKGFPNMTYRGASSGTEKSSGGGGEKKTKKLSDEIERYHEIKEIIDDLTREYDRLSDAKDRAFGPDKLAYLDQEIAKQQELIDAQKEYLSQIEKNLDLDRAELAQHGASFDEYGRVTNYDELIEDAVNKYNAGELSDEGYENFMKTLEQYEETLNLLEEEQDVLIEQQNAIADMRLEKIEIAIEFELKIEDDTLVFLEYQLGKLDDDIDDVAKSLALLGEQTEAYLNKSETYTKGIRDILTEVGASEEQIAAFMAGDSSALDGLQFTEAQMDLLLEYRDGLLETNEALLEMRNTVFEKVTEAFEKMNEELDKSAEKFDFFNSILSSYKDIIDIVGKDTLGIADEMMESLGKASVNNATNSVAAARAILEANERALAEARAAYANATTEEDKEHWLEVIETVEESTREAQENLMSSWTDALQTAADEFEASMERITDAFGEALAGAAGSLDSLQQMFDQQTEISERYVQDYAKIYELSKLNRDINKSINNTDSIAAKKALREMEAEVLAMQESGVELSQHDLDYMRKKYELRLAEIALEEAQNAKNQVRMTRDSEGNWSYTYVADEKKLDQAQQAYEDKLYEMQNFEYERINELQNLIVQAYSDFQSAIRDLQGKNLSPEEYRKELKKLQRYYGDQQNYYYDELQKALSNSDSLYNNEWMAYNNLTGYKISADEKWMDSFDETILSQITGYDSLTEAQNNFHQSTEEMITSLIARFEEYHTTVEEIFEAAGSSVEGFAEEFGIAVKDINEKSNDASEATEDMAQNMGDSFADIIDDAEKWLTDYSEIINNSIAKNESWIESINEMVANYKSAVEEINNTAIDPSYNTPNVIPDGGNPENGDGGGVVPTDPQDTDGETKYYGVFKSIMPKDNQKTIKTGISYDNMSAAIAAAQNYLDIQWKNLTQYYKEEGDSRTWWSQQSHVVQESYHQLYNLFKRQAWAEPISLDTGGYTGSWDSTGRLAMLHQKELILNPPDTENFLSAIGIIREIASVIDLEAVAQSLNLSSLSAVSAMPIDQTLEQEVTIHAEFPNATNRSEIEEAFDSLLNRASQFANRKK